MAQQQTDANARSAFFEWLAQNVSSACLSDLYVAVTDLETYCANKKFLNEPIFEISDAATIDRLRVCLSRDKIFKLFNRKKADRMLSFLQYYAKYISINIFEKVQFHAAASAPNSRPKDSAHKATAAGHSTVIVQTSASATLSKAAAHSIECFRSFLSKQGNSASAIQRLIDALLATDEFISKNADYGGSILELTSDAAVNHILLSLLADDAFHQLNHKYNDCCVSAVQLYVRMLKANKAAKASEAKQNVPLNQPSAIPKPLPQEPKAQVLPVSAVKELPAEKPVITQQLVMEGVAADPVLVYADQNGIAWIDKRHQNGCLWLIGDMSIYPHTIKLHQMGYDFKYAKGGAKATDGRPGWYLQKKPQLVVESPLQPMEAPKAVNPENSISPELFALLAEDEYAPLLECLLQQGITTVEQFEKINPWAFMNRYGLYSIGQRQAIYKQIISRLKPIKQSAPEQLYILQTKATSYQGNSPAESFAAFCENIAQKYPLKIRSLLDMPYNGKGSIVLSRTPSSSDCAKLMNPVAYITGSLTAQAAVVYGQWICKMCNEPDCPVSMSEPQKAQSAVQQPIANTVQPKLESEQHQNAPKETKPPQQTEPSQHFELPKRPDVSAPPKQLGTLSQPTTPRSPEVPKQSDVSVPPQQPEAASQPEITPTSQPEAKTFVPANAFLTERAEKIVLAADIDGISMENLYSQLRTTMIATKQAVADSPRIVSVAGKLIHEDAFVDWEDGANQMEKILDKLLAKNNGYVSAAQLYEYVHADMQMFLNDNNMDDTRAVYDLAQHLFEKVDYHGKHLVFQSKTHISRGETAVTTNLDIMRNFAREQGGFFVEDELEEYLKSVGIKTNGMRTQMQIYSKPTFLFYAPRTFITAESIGFDDAWFATAQKALDNLFADMGDHVVLRDIQPWWYTQLPALPGNRNWTPLLLQSILMHFSKKLKGTHTICAMNTQALDTLHAMIVSNTSEISTFADAVVAFLVDDQVEQRRFEAEELRQLLVQRGMIAGNELIWNMPKALAKDGRFAWDADGKYVAVKV